MRYLFDPDGPVLRFITKLVYSVFCNLLWLLCCIPIFTIGPSTTALFHCMQKIVKDEEGYIAKDFFHFFRSDFKQSAIIGICFTLIGILLGVDGFVLYHLYDTNIFWTIITAVFIVACIFYCFLCVWVFPLQAHFNNQILTTLKNAAMLSIRYLFVTILVLLIYFAMALIIVRFFTPAIVFGFGTCAFFHSLLIRKIFIILEESIGD